MNNNSASEAIIEIRRVVASIGKITPLVEDIDFAIEMLARAYKELNEIRARDGVPYTHMGHKACVSEQYFSDTIDDIDCCVRRLSGRPAHCHPSLYKKGGSQEQMAGDAT